MARSLSNRDLLSQIREIFTGETFLYIVKRSLQAVLTLFLASILCFAIVQLSPGNFLDTLKLNPKITTQRIQLLQAIWIELQ